MQVPKKTPCIFFLALVLFTLTFETPLFAEFKLQDAIEHFGHRRFIRYSPTRLRVGPLKIHSSFATKAQYNTNILLEDQDAREDVIFTLQPGVILELPIDTHQIAVGYEADMEIFSKSRQSSQTDQNQHFFALVDLQFADWYVNVYEYFKETSSRAGTTFTSRIPRYDQSINPKVGVQWKRLTFETGFRHLLRDFRRTIDNVLDFSEREWTGVVYYDLFARLKLFLEYHLGLIEYDNAPTRDARTHRVRIGLEGELMPNLTVETRLGLQLRNALAPERPNFNSWIVKIRFRYEMREDLAFTLSLAREPTEATFQDVSFYVDNRLHFGVSYKPWRQWVVFTNWEITHHDYQERAVLDGRTGFRRDDLFTGRYGVRYEANEWLNFELSYQHLRRDSNFSRLDYTAHRFTLGSTLTY